MIRIVIENLLLFLAPTLIYAGYVYVRRRGDGNGTPVLSDAPLIWLFLAGLLLMVSTLLIFGTTSGWQPGQAYQPPVYKDGKIQPGHVVK
jgi:TRAP-type C4-dicarboxylate transport system permease small subunit